MNTNYEQLVQQALKSISNQRTRDIIRLRYGLKNGQRQTLESIGQKYGITRERVRQVEEAALSDLKKSDLINSFKPVFASIDRFLSQEGRLVREERLLFSLTGSDKPNSAWGSLYFILSLGKPYKRFVESEQLYPLWANSETSLDQAKKVINFLIQKMEKDKELLSLDSVLSLIKQGGCGCSKKVLLSYFDSSKQIGKNSFNQFGLIKWPEVSPRGAKDKAYIVFKESKEPLHFRKVADLLNQANLGTTLAQAQTVHNELINDDSFILVGRGTYALKEWGYQPGTIKDVISYILKNEGVLSKDEILNKVLESRLVKKNTVLINLQNKEYFAKDKDNKYSLVK
ncbi:MAG: sigma factor-like helix-turn-helix DNA-binding protein [bacterium]